MKKTVHGLAEKIFFGDSLIHDEVLCFLPYCAPSLAWCQSATAESLHSLLIKAFQRPLVQRLARYLGKS